jgi:arsenate reductase
MPAASKITLWHNPHCSKSRRALQLLRERGADLDVVAYLDAPPSVEELDRVLRALRLEPRALIRTQEAAYRDLGLADAALGRDALIAAMAAHPILIERPIAIRGDRAVIGRPPENVLVLLE